MPASATPDEPTLAARLARWQELGAAPVIAGPAALTLAQGVPLASSVRSRAYVLPGTGVTALPGVDVVEAADPRGAAEEAAARELPLPWSLVVDAAGVTEVREGALADLASGRLRLRVDPRRWLRGKGRRVLDIAVWAAETGLRPSSELVRAARREAGHVLSLDRAIWRERFHALLLSWKASVGLQFLYDCGALPLLVHEVCAMVDFHKSCPVHHKDIWDHTLQVVDKCPPTLAVRWTALMHDVGKVWTRSVTARGKVHFFRHEELGANLMLGVAARFELPADLRDRVVYVIANHARANVYSTEWTDSAVRRLIRDMGEHLDDVIAFSRSDYTTKRAWRIREVRALGEELIERIVAVREADARVPPLPKGFGNVVMAATGRSGGRWLGDVQRWLEAEVEAEAIAPGLDADTYLAHVQAHNPDLLSA